MAVGDYHSDRDCIRRHCRGLLQQRTTAGLEVRAWLQPPRELEGGWRVQRGGGVVKGYRLYGLPEDVVAHDVGVRQRQAWPGRGEGEAVSSVAGGHKTVARVAEW